MNFGEVLMLVVAGVAALAGLGQLHLRTLSALGKKNGPSNGYGFNDEDRKQLIRICSAVERHSESSAEMVAQLRNEIREAREFRDVHTRRVMNDLDRFECRYPKDPTL
jgi:hypothetical protein